MMHKKRIALAIPGIVMLFLVGCGGPQEETPAVKAPDGSRTSKAAEPLNVPPIGEPGKMASQGGGLTSDSAMGGAPMMGGGGMKGATSAMSAEDALKMVMSTQNAFTPLQKKMEEA